MVLHHRLHALQQAGRARPQLQGGAAWSALPQPLAAAGTRSFLLSLSLSLAAPRAENAHLKVRTRGPAALRRRRSSSICDAGRPSVSAASSFNGMQPIFSSVIFRAARPIAGGVCAGAPVAVPVGGGSPAARRCVMPVQLVATARFEGRVSERLRSGDISTGFCNRRRSRRPPAELCPTSNHNCPKKSVTNNRHD